MERVHNGAMDLPAIDMVEVKSSSLVAVGYDARHELLEVEFRSGAVYRYDRVLLEVYEELVAAESKGAFFNANIRSHYRFVRGRDRRTTE